MTFSKVDSADGTSIAFERSGEGPPLVLVGGAFCDRRAPASGTPLAARLQSRFTVFSYDRRGRGDSADSARYAIDREIEDLAAIVGAAGGSPFLFGNSSGALLALDGAARGLPIAKLALYEPPVILDPSRASAFAAMAEVIATVDRAEAVEMYMTKVMQMPEPAFAGIRRSPMFAGLQSLAHTLAYDLRITARGPARLTELGAISSPTLVIDGGASPPWMRAAIDTLGSAIPGGERMTLEGQTHAVDIDVLGRSLEGFFGA